MIRKAIANSFNTIEMIRMAGDQSLGEHANQLASLEASYQLKKVSASEYRTKKVFFQNKVSHITVGNI